MCSCCCLLFLRASNSLQGAQDGGDGRVRHTRTQARQGQGVNVPGNGGIALRDGGVALGDGLLVRRLELVVQAL